MNPIRQIQELGQSLWYDNIRRGLLDSGELASLIAQGITGVTSNPTIFEKAIDGSHDYDQAIAQIAPTVGSVDALYDALVLEDIARGADLLRPVYENTKGRDGYISIEVPPTMAEETDATIQEAHRLFRALDRPNIMIKVPATPAGIPAIRQLIADGVNVNVTLIFSLDAYRQVIDAYLKGLHERQSRGLPNDRVASVASFFVSRVDTLVDRLIDERGLDADLKGKAAIANAKLAYQLFLERFQSPEFEALKAKGAMVQRPLWASTSTKNPDYPDLLYVEALIGPDTVDTLPPATVDAILDHGRAARTVDQDVDAAQDVINRLEAAGISMKDVTAQLLDEGVKSFHKSFVALRQSLEKKSRVQHEVSPGVFSLGGFQDNLDATINQLNHDRAVPRLWDHDASLWSDAPEHQAIIKNALGWLTVPAAVLEDVPHLESFLNQLVLEGFQAAVVLGMGGSSLVSDVLVHTFSGGRPRLSLHVLDTTDARAIEHLTQQLPLEHTLFIVASKSGSTTEPNAFYHYFWHVLERRGLDPARQFIAITDPGTSMHKEAQARRFREVFLNPADIGGRYSALSWFGMVPAALYGLDVRQLLTGALAMQEAAQNPDAGENPAARLGATLGALAKAGRDKVTLIMPDPISHLGDWLEQLLAESTGKLGTGLVPIAHEPVLTPAEYSQDRVFVVYQWRDEAPGIATDALKAAGHPVIEYHLTNPYQVAQEFYRWEVATAIAGAVLQIDAFDQPNVQESKDNTKAILGKLENGRLPDEALMEGPKGIRWTASEALKSDDLQSTLKKLYDLAGASSYLAIMAYIEPTAEADHAVSHLRTRLSALTGRPTTFGYGPRFLHSTGQLHKGGPATGLFVQIVSQDGPRLEVPGDGYDFLTLMQAQALGDYQSLQAHGRAVVRILAPHPATQTIEMLADWAH
ncbi:bifunctional transaldolase/phosoglucose isomerase [Sulfobacillus harzensis]|uniref:Transaldolase n=1 Tax=Sulfobacillus harzensis TaxID=2729629 RepID=A0A7Y0Q439_9FIRM|nr:bifunctional transaldolase/phosoglucose isomerase [Sulfobacillus harzensis]NMP22834.1 bifunctional transaldolase/phosoglucose isomerase [Sulfobacillus harzensis]